MSSDSLDLIEDPELFVPNFFDLFGKKFEKAFLKELKLSKELDSLVRGKYHCNANKQKPFRHQPEKGPGSSANVLFWRQRQVQNSDRRGRFPYRQGKAGNQAQFSSKETNTNRYDVKPLSHLRTKLTKGPESGALQSFCRLKSLKIDFLTISKPPHFAGRLRNFLPNWPRVTLDPEILDIVVSYKLELTASPVQHKVKVPLQFSLAESEKIEAEIADLLHKGALTSVTPDSDYFVSNLFLVPKRDDNSRPAMNLKDLNAYLQYNHFKMEEIHLLRDLVRPSDWWSKIDLKDAYFVIPI